MVEHFFDASDSDDEFEQFDLFHFHELCEDRCCRDCTNETIADILQAHNEKPEACLSPSIQAVDGLTQLEWLMSQPSALLSVGPNSNPVIFDTGASLAVAHDKCDFDGPLTKPQKPLRLGGMANGLTIEGIGTVTWTFPNTDGSEVQIRTNCCCVPEAKAWPMSPQHLFNKEKGTSGHCEGDEDLFHLCFDKCPPLVVPCDSRSLLPVAQAAMPGANLAPPLDLSLASKDNQNLTAGQKLLLEGHACFGHLNFPHLKGILCCVPFETL